MKVAAAPRPVSGDVARGRFSQPSRNRNRGSAAGLRSINTPRPARREQRFVCEFGPVPVFGISDRVFVWENWGKIIDNKVALNVGFSTPKTRRLLDESGLLIGKNVRVGEVHIGGYIFERINILF